MNRRNQIIIVAGLIIVGAYAAFTNLGSDLDEAKEIATQYYGYLMANDLESASNLYHPELLEFTDLEETNSFLQTVNTKLGEITEYELIDSNIKSTTGTGGTVIRVDLQYQVKRTKYDSTESMVLISENKSPFLIYGYNINSDGFLEDS